MEKILMIHNCDLLEVQNYLDRGWKVKLIEPVGKGFGSAFVVLEKPDKTPNNSSEVKDMFRPSKEMT